MTAVERLRRALAVLGPVMDVIEERAVDEQPPAWCDQRGWTGFLLGLDDRAVAACEADGLCAHLPSLADVPRELADLAVSVTAAGRLPALEARPVALEPRSLRAVPARKQAQLAALLEAVAPMADAARRVVDVGAGSGHFTRLSAELFARDALGIEQSATRVAAATRRLAEAPGARAARYVTREIDAETLALEPRDLAVGLHACGSLGDELVRAVGEAGCDLALVSCCLQKRRAPHREPLSVAAGAFRLRREVLGLTNLTAQPMGVEVSIEATLRAREVRFALGRLLRERGIAVEPGAEMRGLNRRRAGAGLAAVARQALALRGLPAPTAAEIARHEREAAPRFARVRRFSLPRSMLARLLEIAVVLDRASLLEERGLTVAVTTAFERSVTPRNVALFASRAPERVPAG